MMAPLTPASSHQGLRRYERIGPLVLSEIIHPAELRIGWHSHELAAFALTLRGSSTETFTSAGFERTAHSLLLRPAGERHWDSIGSQGATCFLIEVGGEWMGGVPRSSSILRRPYSYGPGAITRLAQQAYREWSLSDTASPLAIEALALEIAAHLIRDGERCTKLTPPLWLRRVKQRLDEDFRETPSLAELARIGDVHPTHLCRHFRRHYYATIGEYLRQRRVDAAIQLLSRTTLSLTEVALESGFSSHAQFCTIFKRATGTTPGYFRQTRR